MDIRQMGVKLKRVLRTLYKCNPVKFIYYNFITKKVIRKKGCYLLPGRRGFIWIQRGAKLILNGNLFLNFDTSKRIRNDSNLILHTGSVLCIRGDVKIRYGSTIQVSENAKADFGHFTSNIGLNIQCDHAITIGDDCMMGRCVTIYDSTYHPVGTDIQNMKKNMVPVAIGNHVWLGAHVAVLPGTVIGDGSIVGINSTVSGVIPPTARIVPRTDTVFSVGNLWARSMEDLNAAEPYMRYGMVEPNTSVSIGNNNKIQEYKKRIGELLSTQLSGIDFTTDVPLVDGGILDSLNMIMVVEILSREFNIDIPYTQVYAKNFNSLENIAKTVLRLENTLDRSTSNWRQNQLTRSTVAEMEPLILDEQDTCKPVVQHIYKFSKMTPDAAAIIANDRITTYSELWKLILVAKRWLLREGVCSGDRIIVRALHNEECVAVYYAIHLIGSILVPVEKTARKERVMEIASEVGATLIVGIDEDEAIHPIPHSFSYDTVFADTTVMVSESEKIDFPDVDLPCEMVFTTGTTGKSKGVLMTHRHIAWYAYSLAKGIEMKKGNRFFITTPLNHAGGLRRTHLSLANGCALVYMDGLSDLNKYFTYIEKYHVTSLYLPPVAIRILLTRSGNEISKYKDQIDFVYSSSSYLPLSDCERMRELLPNSRLYNAYEASETPGVSVYNYNVEDVRKNCLGKANIGVEVGVMLDDGTITNEAGMEGKICVKSKMNMREYYAAPELTSSVMKDDWFISNDIGEMDEEGCLYYKGREGDVINIGGYKIAPTDVEEVALRSGMVRESICISESDEHGFTHLKLLVVPDASSFNVHKFTSFMAKWLETYKLPQKVEIVREIAKTFNGKLDRKKYRSNGV